MASKKDTKPKQNSAEKVAGMKILKEALDKIDKDFGKGTVMLLGEKPHNDIEAISTGSIGLDLALGIGGLPKGRVVEIYGPESSGKTTLAMHIIANVQNAGGKAAIVDAEHAFDSAYATALGINIDDLLISQPDYGEQALEVTDRLVNTGQVDVIVIDSVAALVPKSELEGEMGDSKMGLHARLMSQALRKLTGKVHKTGTLVIFINQLRDKIGVMFGSPETTTGGNALKFYASVRLDVRKIAQVKDGEEITANTIRVKVVKNKVAPPFRFAEFDLVYGEGIDKYSELVKIATDLDVVQKSGSWYSYGNDKLGQGKESIKKLFQDNDDLYQEILKKVESKLWI